MEIEQPFEEYDAEESEEYDAEESCIDDNGYSIPCYYSPISIEEIGNLSYCDEIHIGGEEEEPYLLYCKCGSFHFVDSRIYEMLCSWIYSIKRDKEKCTAKDFKGYAKLLKWFDELYLYEYYFFTDLELLMDKDINISYSLSFVDFISDRNKEKKELLIKAEERRERLENIKSVVLHLGPFAVIFIAFMCVVFYCTYR